MTGAAPIDAFGMGARPSPNSRPRDRERYARVTSRGVQAAASVCMEPHDDQL